MTPSVAFAQQQIFVISRERVLRDTAAARELRQAESRLTAQLQRQIQEAKDQLSKEEIALARDRAELSAEDFELRAADFDRRVRRSRRIAQERANLLQTGFKDARARIVAALPPLLEQVRIEVGARIILDADQVITADPTLDLTDKLINLVDQEVPRAEIPDIDLSEPIFSTDPVSVPDTDPPKE